MLIKQIKKPQAASERTGSKYANEYLYGRKKKENLMEYDLKTNKVVEVKKKKKRNYGGDSESDN